MIQFERSKKSDKILILEKGVSKEVIETTFLQQLHVDEIIRIQEKDYEHIPQEYLTHFNLEESGHEIGKLYALPKIIKSGYYTQNGDEQLPLLDFNDILVGKCVEVVEHMTYEELGVDDFKYSLKHISDVASLQKEILFRYQHSMPDLSESQILALGVSKTTLKIKG